MLFSPPFFLSIFVSLDHELSISPTIILFCSLYRWEMELSAAVGQIA